MRMRYDDGTEAAAAALPVPGGWTLPCYCAECDGQMRLMWQPGKGRMTIYHGEDSLVNVGLSPGLKLLPTGIEPWDTAALPERERVAMILDGSVDHVVVILTRRFHPGPGQE